MVARIDTLPYNFLLASLCDLSAVCSLSKLDEDDPIGEGGC